jgi:hypothetical protein
MYLGNRGSGKTAGLEVRTKGVALAGRFAVFAYDWPGSYARAMTGHLSACGLEGRTYYERLRDLPRVMRWRFRRPTTASPLERINAEELARQQIVQAFLARKGVKVGEDKAYTRKWLDAAVAVWSSLPETPPLWWLRKCFEPGSPEHLWMMRHAADRDAVVAFAAVEERKYRNPVQYEIECGAAVRALDVVKNPVLWTRFGDDAEAVDIRALALAKALVFFDLSGVALETARAFVVLHTTAVVNECQRYFEETGKPLEVILVLEEAGPLALATPVIIWALQTLRKAGVYVWVVSLTVEDFPPELFEQLMGLTDAHYFYRMNAGIDRAAKDLADPTWQERQVYATRDRQEHDGEDVVRTVTESEFVGDDGKKRKGKTVSERFVPRYRTVVEEVYVTPQLHEQRFRTELATNEVFQRHVRDLAGVRRERVEPLGEPWPLGLTAERTAEAITRIQSRRAFQPPRMAWTPPSPAQPVPVAPQPPRSAAAPAPVPTPTGGRGMRRSSNS